MRVTATIEYRGLKLDVEFVDFLDADDDAGIAQHLEDWLYDNGDYVKDPY